MPVATPATHRAPVLLRRWAGNIWASTGCSSSFSEDYQFPSTTKCVTNFCPDGGVCPDYRGPSGVTTKAEFALLEGGYDFYDVSIIDGRVMLSCFLPLPYLSFRRCYYYHC